MSYKRGLRSAANAVAESEPKRLKKTTTVTTTDKDQQADAKSRSTEKSYWLFKAEPESRIVNGVDVKFSFDDLKTEHQATWDGVRNFEARNTMKKMNVGDLGFFYQSNCKIPGIVGKWTVHYFVISIIILTINCRNPESLQIGVS